MKLSLSNSSVGIVAAGLTILTAIGVFSILPALAAETPTITATAQNGSNVTITSAQIGSGVHANVVVASSTASTSPTGTVDFTLYDGVSCLGTGSVQAGVALVAGVAKSATTTMGTQGLSYRAHYNGQGSLYNPGDSNCVSVSATKFSPTISTDLSANNVVAGSFVHDSATLSGASAYAGGSVAYKVYSNNSCTSLALDAGQKTVTNGAIPNSESWQFITPGTYYWQVVYSGDTSNNGATSTCASEVLVVTPTTTPIVKASPTINTTLSTTSAAMGSSVFDSAVFVNATSTTSGIAVYKVYTNDSCTRLYQNAGTKTVTNASIPDSDSIQFNRPGTYYWQVTYGGDDRTNPATSACNEVLIITQNGTPVPPATGVGTISGTVFNDLNKNEKLNPGEPGLSGWTVVLHKSNMSSAWKKLGKKHGAENYPIVLTTTTDANGMYSFGNLSPGKYFVEEQVKAGWKQTSHDVKVTIGTSTSKVVNFANVEKKPKNNDNNQGNHDDNENNNQGNTNPDWKSLFASFKVWWKANQN